jgi:hypothetical protein
LCEAALSLDSAARLAFLDQECGGDDCLRREIECNSSGGCTN